jgi:hypothetical protein
MIEITFFNFHEHDYKYDRYCLYVMKNGSGGILYVGISTNDVWVRWFGWGGHLMWDGNVIYGESTIGEKIENHLPESLRWKIQLWTLEDCQKYCGQEIAVADSAKTFEEYKQAILDIEPFMIRKIRPARNDDASSLPPSRWPCLNSPRNLIPRHLTQPTTANSTRAT